MDTTIKWACATMASWCGAGPRSTENVSSAATFAAQAFAHPIQIVRPLESTAETQPQLQPRFLRLSAMKMSLRSFANTNRGIGIQTFNGQRFLPELGVGEKPGLPCKVYKNGHQSGPFTFSKIQSMWQAGTINATDQIRRGDQQKWHTIGNISRHLELDHNKLQFSIVPTIMLVFLGLAFISSFALVWRMYS